MPPEISFFCRYQDARSDFPSVYFTARYPRRGIVPGAVHEKASSMPFCPPVNPRPLIPATEWITIRLYGREYIVSDASCMLYRRILHVIPVLQVYARLPLPVSVRLNGVVPVSNGTVYAGVRLQETLCFFSVTR